MECPACDKEAELFAEVHQNGMIGCFCHHCKKGYVTEDPEKGLDHVELSLEAIQDLKMMHGIYLPPMIMEVAMEERRMI